MKTKYRFKTIKEFEKEYGENWRQTVNFNYDGLMDYLAGQSVSDSLGDSIIKRKVAVISQKITNEGKWVINPLMITSNFQTSYQKFKEIISVVQRCSMTLSKRVD